MLRLLSVHPLFPLTFAIVLTLGSATSSYGQETKEAKQENKPIESPATDSTKISDFAWIAGHWRGEALGGTFEETWNPPMGNTMMGMFKLAKDDKISFYEILTIVKEEGKFLLRLKHFNDKLVGWEEKDKSVEFPLLSVSDKEAIFDGLKFIKIDRNTMHIIVKVESNGEANELKFVCRRAEPATPPKR